jgi:hypothetical protein
VARWIGHLRSDGKCGYLISALFYLDKAVNLAKEKEYHEIYAKGLYLRGYCYNDIWRLSLDKERDYQYFIRSLEDQEEAENLVNRQQDRFSSALCAASTGGMANGLARVAQDAQDRSKALHMSDKEAAIISSTNFKHDPYFLQINKDWYSLGKAQIYLAFGSPKAALEILDTVPEGDLRQMRRFLSRTIAEAEAYIAQGQIDIGIEYAIVALEAARGLRAKLHLVRITGLYKSLKQNEKYRKEPYVARLGVELLKAEHPELF